MIVELYEKDGYWWLKSSGNIEWSTALSVADVLPLQGELKSTDKIKQIKKLRALGYGGEITYTVGEEHIKEIKYIGVNNIPAYEIIYKNKVEVLEGNFQFVLTREEEE